MLLLVSLTRKTDKIPAPQSSRSCTERSERPQCMLFDVASLSSAVSSVHPQVRLRLRRHAEIFSQLDSYLRFLTRRHFLDCREYIEHHLFAGVRGRMGLVFHRFPFLGRIVWRLPQL